MEETIERLLTPQRQSSNSLSKALLLLAVWVSTKTRPKKATGKNNQQLFYSHRKENGEKFRFIRTINLEHPEKKNKEKICWMFFLLADLSLYDRVRSDPRLVQRKRDSSGLKNYLQTEHKLPLIDAEEVR